MKIKAALPFLSIFVLIVTIMVAVTTRAPTAITIAWLTLAVFGAYMAVSSIVYSIKCYMSKYWPKSIYTIIDERIRKKIVDDYTSYTVSANLEYEVNGNIYLKDLRDDYNESYFDSRDDALKYINTIKSDGNNYIYYNPGHPEESILEPGINIRSILAIIVGLGMAYAGIGTILGAVHWA